MVAWKGQIWHGNLFYKYALFWKNLRTFSFYNRTVFETFFILLYAIEQIVLISLIFTIRDNESSTLIISIFAIVVLTTFALHKMVMESRIKVLEEKLKEISSLNKEGNEQIVSLQENRKELAIRCEQLALDNEELSKHLNTNKGKKR